jgi:hypothetical protein
MALQIASFLQVSGTIAATTTLSGLGSLLRAILRLLLGKGAPSRSSAGMRMTTMMIIVIIAASSARSNGTLLCSERVLLLCVRASAAPAARADDRLPLGRARGAARPLDAECRSALGVFSSGAHPFLAQFDSIAELYSRKLALLSLAALLAASHPAALARLHLILSYCSGVLHELDAEPDAAFVATPSNGAVPRTRPVLIACRP